MAENKRTTGFRGPSPDVGKPYRWKPGESGNPGGRPKRRPITDLYEEQLHQRLPEAVRLKLGLKEGATYGHAVAFRQVQKAILGETQAAREITDRVEGKAVARIAGAEGGPVEINIADRIAQLRAAKDATRDQRAKESD